MPEFTEEFVRGVRLFNEGKFFEAHEAWEIIWLKAEGDEREFLHAVIQAAAALHHAQLGNLKGAQSVGRRAIRKLVKLPQLQASLEKFLTEPDAPIPHIALRDEIQ